MKRAYVQIKVYYPCKKILPKLDNEIRKRIESIGGEWWAQGYDRTTQVRDMAFDLPILVEPYKE